MADNPADRRSAPRFAATFRIRLGYPDLHAFLDGYAVNMSKGGIYVPTKQPREKGTEVRFELLLKDGTAAVVGVGRVAWAKAFDPNKPGERYGMGVQFVALEGASDDIVQKAMIWREQHGHADKEVTDDGDRPAEPKPEPAAAEPKPEPEPQPEPEPTAADSTPKPEPTPKTTTPASRDRAGLARKVLGKQKVTMGNVDDLLASLRSKQPPKRPAAAAAPAEPEPKPEPEPQPELPAATTPAEPEPKPEPKPEPTPEVPAPAEPEPEAPAPDPYDGVSAYVIAGVETTPVPPEPIEPEPEPIEPEPEPRAPTPQRRDDDGPSLEDLEAALASVSIPPPAPGANGTPADGMLDIDIGAPAVAARTAHGGSDDADGLELPGWDDEPAAPTLSEQLAHDSIASALGAEDPASEIIEASDDLDLESLPRNTRELRILTHRPVTRPSPRPSAELFADIPGAAPAEPPPPATPSQPELPVVGGLVPDRIEEAVRQKLAASQTATDEAAEDGETAVMTQDEQVILDRLMQAQAPARPSVADLPPPPDMPAPIPESPVEERKSGILGRLFGRKKK